MSRFGPVREVTVVVFTLVLLCRASATSPESGFSQSGCLSVAAEEFAGAAKAAVDAMRAAVEDLSKMNETKRDFRTSNAILDCLDLLDFGSDLLSSSIQASRHPNGKDNSTGDLTSDLKAWISAAFSGTDTCLEGFESTQGTNKISLTGDLNRIGPMIRNLLTMVNPKPNPKPKPIKTQNHLTGSGHGGFNKFPSWVRPNDRKMLQAYGVPVADVVVAADGTGNFTTITDAIAAAPDKSMKRFVIYVKEGIYHEYVEIGKKKLNITMIGDGIDRTVITGNHNYVDGWTTFRSATFAVRGSGFMARDITFENTAGPEKHQAVAFRSDSDLSVLFRCAMRGYQDTLYVHSLRQFFRECVITGTVDFIFGDAAAVFQNCQIVARQGMPKQKNMITAQGRKDPDQPTGFVIQFSNIMAGPDLLPNVNTTATYLGRPWKTYSRTVFMQNNISGAVHPEGWHEWKGDYALDTLYYAEYMNYGAGSRLDGRVKWPGYHVLNGTGAAANFTVASFIEGALWLPATGVKYTSGLTS